MLRQVVGEGEIDPSWLLETGAECALSTLWVCIDTCTSPGLGVSGSWGKWLG